MKQKILLLVFPIIFCLKAYSAAGLFVEPMLTYEHGQADVDLPAPFGSSDSQISGLGVGAQLGLHVLDTVFIAIDGRYSMPTYKNDDTNIHTNAIAYNFGPVAGIHMPAVTRLVVDSRFYK